MAWAPPADWSLSRDVILCDSFRRTTERLALNIDEVMSYPEGRLFRQAESIVTVAGYWLRILDAAENMARIEGFRSAGQFWDKYDHFVFPLKQMRKALDSENIQELYSVVAEIYTICADFLQFYVDHPYLRGVNSYQDEGGDPFSWDLDEREEVSSRPQSAGDNPDIGNQQIQISREQALQPGKLTPQGGIKQWTIMRPTGKATTVTRHIEEAHCRKHNDKGGRLRLCLGNGGPGGELVYEDGETRRTRTLDEFRDSEGNHGWEAKSQECTVSTVVNPKLEFSLRQFGASCNKSITVKQRSSYVYKTQTGIEMEKHWFPELDSDDNHSDS